MSGSAQIAWPCANASRRCLNHATAASTGGSPFCTAVMLSAQFALRWALWWRENLEEKTFASVRQNGFRNRAWLHELWWFLRCD